MCWSPVWIFLGLLLCELVVAGAVVSDLWVWDTSSLAIGERESLIEVWAVRKAGMCWSPVWIFLGLLLCKLVVAGAVISDLWVWDTSSLSISESESLVKVWAMWKA